MEFFFGTFTSEWEQRRAALLHEMTLGGRGRAVEEELGHAGQIARSGLAQRSLLGTGTRRVKRDVPVLDRADGGFELEALRLDVLVDDRILAMDLVAATQSPG